MGLFDKLFGCIREDTGDIRAENIKNYFDQRTPRFNNGMLIIGDDVIKLKNIIDVTVLKDEHITPYGQVMADFWEVHVLTLEGGTTIASFDTSFQDDDVFGTERGAKQDAYDLKDMILQKVKCFRDKQKTREDKRDLKERDVIDYIHKHPELLNSIKINK